jgi:Na+-translocating ferredoxin:NAD+ oxidoreductase subunit G
MKKLESTFRNMVLALSSISIVAAAALGMVYDVTKGPIQQAEQAKEEAAIRSVTVGFDNSPVDEKYPLKTPEGDSIWCYPAKEKGQLTGVAILSYSSKGFGGRIEIMVGLKPDGTIYNYSVLKHKETPGLGSKMDDWFRVNKNKQSILGLDPAKAKLQVSKDGGAVDAITAATISSRAFLDAVDRAYQSYMISQKARQDVQKKKGATDEK